MAEFYRLAASDALRLIRQGKLTVEDYAKSLLSRINERDHIIHAWAYLDPDLVISQARRLDSIPPESRGPLHGLPIGIKDIALTKGNEHADVILRCCELTYQICQRDTTRQFTKMNTARLLTHPW